MSAEAKKWIAIGCGSLAFVGLCLMGFATVFLQQCNKLRIAGQEIAETSRDLAEEARRRELERKAEEEAARAAAPPPIAEVAAYGLPPELSIAPGPARDRSPRRITAQVTRAEGAAGVAVGTECRFDVTVHDDSSPAGYWCRAFVQCGGVPLYGREQDRNGYFPCALFDAPRGVAGEERVMSAAEGDGAFQIDTRAGTFHVVDDHASFRGGAFAVDARITAVE